MSRRMLGLISKSLMCGALTICFLIFTDWPIGRTFATSTHKIPNTSLLKSQVVYAPRGATLVQEAERRLHLLQETERRLVILTGSAAPNSRGQVPIQLNSLGDEHSLSFSISFNPVVLSGPMVELESTYAGALLEVNTSQVGMGRLGIRLTLPSGVVFQAGVRNILRVSFAISASAGAGPQPIDTGDMPVMRRILNATGNILP